MVLCYLFVLGFSVDISFFFNSTALRVRNSQELIADKNERTKRDDGKGGRDGRDDTLQTPLMPFSP